MVPWSYRLGVGLGLITLSHKTPLLQKKMKKTLVTARPYAPQGTKKMGNIIRKLSQGNPGFSIQLWTVIAVLFSTVTLMYMAKGIYWSRCFYSRNTSSNSRDRCYGFIWEPCNQSDDCYKNWNLWSIWTVVNNKILASDWLSPAMIFILIGQCNLLDIKRVLEEGSCTFIFSLLRISGWKLSLILSQILL